MSGVTLSDSKSKITKTGGGRGAFAGELANLSSPLASDFFGGKDEVVNSLLNAIRDELKRKNLSPKDLDSQCGFGTSSKSGRARSLPATADVLERKAPLSSLYFNLAAAQLNLSVDTIMHPRISEEISKSIAKDLKSRQLGFKYGAGGNVRAEISDDSQVAVYLYVKAIRELDTP